MGWFNPSKHLSRRAERELRSFAECGQSEASAVASFLNDVAESEEAQATDEYLADCAEELAAVALAAAHNLKGGEDRDSLMARFWEGVDQKYTHIGVIRALVEEMHPAQIRRALEELEDE
jgi:hypothetical protein